VQLSRIALVLGSGPEAGDAPAVVVGVEVQVQADGVVDAAHETHYADAWQSMLSLFRIG
jgi:hypothetical protein